MSLRKLKITRRLVIVLIVLLVFMQVVTYIVNVQGKYNPVRVKYQMENNKNPLPFYIVYYFALNLYIIPTIILFVISRRLKNKINKEKCSHNDSTGQRLTIFSSSFAKYSL